MENTSTLHPLSSKPLAKDRTDQKSPPARREIDAVRTPTFIDS
jgi:hypothetical protein